MNTGDDTSPRLHLPPPGTYNEDIQPEALKPGRSSRIASREMMLQLTILEMVRPVGRPLTQRVIAQICGCSNALIYLITKQALAKMHREARRQQMMEEKS